MMGDNIVSTIAIYDSGVGGLSTLKLLSEKFPNNNFIYFADKKYAPYGDKDINEIIERSKEIVRMLQNEGANFIISACNTAAALCKDIKLTDLPYFSMLDLIGKIDCTGVERVTVIATTNTVWSGVYSETLHQNYPHLQVTEIACPELAQLIEASMLETDVLESDMMESAEIDRVVRSYCDVITQQGTQMLIYGCTHYPIVDGIFATYLDAGVARVDPIVYFPSLLDGALSDHRSTTQNNTVIQYLNS